MDFAVPCIEADNQVDGYVDRPFKYTLLDGTSGTRFISNAMIRELLVDRSRLSDKLLVATINLHFAQEKIDSLGSDIADLHGTANPFVKRQRLLSPPTAPYDAPYGTAPATRAYYKAPQPPPPPPADLKHKPASKSHKKIVRTVESSPSSHCKTQLK